MPFIHKLLKYKSLSIVGLEKNTGKTVCLNYVLRRLNEEGVHPAVTSIGVDGEQTDAIYGSAKPEVRLYDGSLFITSERHYRQRLLVSELLEVSQRRTSLGRMITARVQCGGKILLSGAASTLVLRRQIAHLRDDLTVPLTIVDGALSRLSLASPTVSEAMILATGAAVSANLPQLIAKTRFIYDLIQIPAIEEAAREALTPCTTGLWALDSDNKARDLGIASVFLLDKYQENLLRFGNTIFAAGAVSDRLLHSLCQQKEIKDITLVARDFTKFFITPETMHAYLMKGGRLKVLQQSHLIAITLNPTSPRGYNLHSEDACAALTEALGIPVYDVMRANT